MSKTTVNKTPEQSALAPALTPEMQKCLNQISTGDGTITRHPGGFWYPSGDGKLSFGTTTVEALVKRGRLEYCEWKESHGRKFAIKARIAPNESSSATAPPKGIKCTNR